MICRGLQKTFGIEAAEALGGQLFPEAVQGGGGGFVGGLLRDTQLLADLGVAMSRSDEGEDLPGAWRQ